MFLTADEIYTLTNRVQGAAQIRRLRQLGIRHHVRDGKPVVTRLAVEGKERSNPDRIRWEAVT
jgi:hypothetical protein